MRRSTQRYRSRTSTMLVAALAVALALAALVSPGAAQTAAAKPAAADTTKARAAAKTPVDKKAARAKRKEEARAKKLEARTKEDQQDVAEKHAWVRGANWLGLRAGTGAASERGRPNPGPGFGFGLQHFVNRRWALGVQLDYDLLGKYAGAAEIEVPMHLELTRHFDWGEQMRPYLGASAGGTWHRTYRTGADDASMRPSLFIVSGANMPIAPRSLMGLDVRVGWEKDARSADPVFPNGSSSLLTWRAKVAYLRWQ